MSSETVGLIRPSASVTLATRVVFPRELKALLRARIVPLVDEPENPDTDNPFPLMSKL